MKKTNYREKLIAEKERLIKQINNLSDEESLSFKDSVGNLSNYDNHPADIGSEVFEREKDAVLKHNNVELLEQVEEAIKALDKGDYGYCKDCGEKIKDERLEAIPYTLRCSKCSEKNEKYSEEDYNVMHPVGSNSGDDISHRDDDAWREVEKHGTSSSELKHYNPDDFED